MLMLKEELGHLTVNTRLMPVADKIILILFN